MNPKPLESLLKESGKNKNISITYNFEEFKDQLSSLKENFLKLAERLEQAAQELRGRGRIAAEDFPGEVENCRHRFMDLRAKVLEVGISLNLPDLPKPEAIGSINELESIVNSFSEIEEKRKTFEEVRNRALWALGRVQSMVHRDKTDFPPLAECKAKAAGLRKIVESSRWPEANRDVEVLAGGAQVFSDLVTLVETSSELDDVRWGNAQDSVQENFGKALAVAASRGKLAVSAEPIIPKVPRLFSENKPAPPPPPVVATGTSENVSGKEAPPKARFEVESARREAKPKPHPGAIEDKSDAIFDFVQKLTHSLQEKKKP